MVAQILFYGDAEEWHSYCRRVCRLYQEKVGKKLQSIYLVRLEFEFEAGIGVLGIGGEVGNRKGALPALPAYSG